MKSLLPQKFCWFTLLLIVYIGLAIPNQSSTQVTRQYLTSSWTLKIDSCPQPDLNSLVINTTVPTVLHLDLLREKKIDDPFFGDNYKRLQYVSHCNITYSVNFTYNKLMTNADLVFQGIDTYSTIKLNGKQISKTKNAFVEQRIRLTRQELKLQQNNLIQVEIYSTQRIDQLENSKNRMPFIYAHSRKAAYQYSWDWAPYLNTLGIWKPVYIQYFQDAKIDYTWIRNKQVRKQYAILNFATALNFTQSQSAIKQRYKIQITNNNTKLAEVLVTSKHVYIDVKIQNPKFWWPNGIGKQNMYDFEVKLIRLADKKQVDLKNVAFGIRTVRLDRSGQKFTVYINGYPIYCKGANYVPPDMFYPRTSNPSYTPGNTYKKLLDDAVESHFNMIRVWGGGQYQSDQFLELASRKGIMLFYDFMFSDSIYPSTKQFLQNVEEQITQQVRRTRNYPCLTLWSGNNQILQGIQSWGWGKESYRQDYQRLFEETIRFILQKQNPDIPYIPSSPVNGVGNGGLERGGDVHYWGVWAAGSLFQAYKNAIGPFNSEFGTQSIPVWETVKNFTAPEQRSYASIQFLAHQRHNSQFNTLTRYIKAYAHPSRNFELETYLSGLIQAFGIQIAIKHQRISKPKSYGTLYWQFNDAWPAISWSSIDYFGRWKPLQYMAKRLYPDVAVFCADGKIVAVNDNLYSVQAVVLIKIQNLNGNTIFNQSKTVELAPNQVKTIEQLQKNNYKQQLDSIVVYSEIIFGREKQMSSTFFFANFKDLKIDPMARLFVKILPEYNLIKLSTDKFIKNLYISSTKQYIKLSDNYFDMIANKVYKVVLSNQHNLGQLNSTLLFRSYAQIHTDIKLQVVYE